MQDISAFLIPKVHSQIVSLLSLPAQKKPHHCTISGGCTAAPSIDAAKTSRILTKFARYIKGATTIKQLLDLWAGLVSVNLTGLQQVK